ncbi:single-stranded-DNA-specific exonuclease [Methylobacterium phyllostachyos]|uniref:Single-stranded-DNA-specific exonuclease n=1 Tax=Methylobacterium phyllostachyos TaxID=582672 RepID=A0A1H0KPZ1_9HYPH|nr:phosphoesterase [Methylobacterium phyllostachyos]SDO57843.1 single-stranded-DNA-specific exonuclease [Methylobacterium phyllostachyos]
MTDLASHGAAFARAVSGFGPTPPVVLCHDDADGVSAGAILGRALERAGYGPIDVQVIGRGASAWAPATREALASRDPGGIVVTDLGVQAGDIVPGVPTVLVDHHVPRSLPDSPGTTVISGHGDLPIPTSSLLAHACAAALGEAGDLAWLAGIGLVGDLGERGANGDFPDVMAPLRKTYTAKALREAVSLLNAPRRSASGDAGPALRLLLRATGPADVVAGTDPDAAALRAARIEVKAALDAARGVPPLFAGPVALVLCRSPCQIHPLLAQSWTGRLRRQVVIGANLGFRPGYVHFAVRSASVPDLIRFLRERAPTLGPDDQFAQGHQRAAGGQVRVETWNRFMSKLGFGLEAQAA